MLHTELLLITAAGCLLTGYAAGWVHAARFMARHWGTIRARAAAKRAREGR